MNILTGVQNVLEYINNNWTAIIIIIGLAIAIVKKVKDFFSKTNEEKIATAKQQIKEIMLKLITDAETDYQTWIKAGAVKRSQVINQVFEMYPILSKIANQEELIEWIDNVIDDSLETMRVIFTKQVNNEEQPFDEVDDTGITESNEVE